MSAHPEKAESLWVLTVGPTAWAAHFLLCYVTAAVYCAKAPIPDVGLEALRIAIAVFTLAALLVITVAGVYGFRRHRTGVDEPPPHREDTPGDRHRFIGFATLLLCGLSAVATLYVAMVAWFFESCR